MKLLILLLLTTLYLLGSDAILELDTRGHTGMIKNIIVTKNHEIISASNDKTIKIWSEQSKLLRRIDGQIGSGSMGKIHTIALSPDEKLLAVGGYLNTYGNIDWGTIRLYDYHSGKLLSLLQSHNDVVVDLSFSIDGSTLVSGSLDHSFRLWDMHNNTLKSSTYYHTSEVYGVEIIDGYVYSVGIDKKIAKHTMDGEYVASYSHTQSLLFLASNRTDIATCGKGNEIIILDRNLKLKRIITSTTKPAGLAYSADGKTLLAGISASPYNVVAYDASKNYAIRQTFKRHDNITTAVAFLDNATAISAGDDKESIYIWDIASGKVATTIQGSGRSVWSVGVKGESIAWGNTWTASYGKSAFGKSFNLSTLTLGADTAGANRINSTGLSHSVGGDYGYADAVLNIQSTGDTITKGSINGINHNCYGWWGEYIISG